MENLYVLAFFLDLNLLFCYFIVGLLGAHLLMFIVTVILIAAGVDVIPLEFDQLPLDIRNNKFYLRGLAWQFRDENNDVIFKASVRVNSSNNQSIIVTQSHITLFSSLLLYIYMNYKI